MKQKLKYWLFRLLFPDHELATPLEDLRREYERKLMSAWSRSPLDESLWVRRFTALDADYKALEKEMADVQVENWRLKSQLQRLVS